MSPGTGPGSLKPEGNSTMNLSLPANMIEFDHLYRDDEACRKALMAARWPDGFICPRCNHDDGHELRARPVIECTFCGHQVSATAGTLFHNAKLELNVLFKMTYLLVCEKSGTNMSALARQCGVSYPTALLWARKIRCVIDAMPHAKLKGKVEVDETMIGGPSPGHPGRSLGPNQAWVLVLVEDKGGGTCGRIRLEAADTASSEELTGLVEKHVESGSTVTTDGWEGYNKLKSKGYQRETKVAKQRKDASVELPLVHRVASLLKRFINGVLHGSWSRQWIGWMLNEFAFRFNRRNSKHRPLLFNRVLEGGITRVVPTRNRFRCFSRLVTSAEAA